jgi:hypothetical protein
VDPLQNDGRADLRVTVGTGLQQVKGVALIAKCSDPWHSWKDDELCGRRPFGWFVFFPVVAYTAMQIGNRQMDGMVTDNQTAM